MNFSLLKVLYNCRVEPFLLFIMMSYAVRGVTFTQLIQDKLCKFKHSMDDDFCRHLSEVEEQDPRFYVKSSVLVQSSQFQMYYQALQFLPSIIACLFLGSWCDNYKHGRKILLYVSTIGAFLEIIIQAYMTLVFDMDYNYLILAAVPSALGGGLGSGLTAILSYIPATTPQSFRTLRFMLVELSFYASSLISTLLGGFLLNYNIFNPIGGRGQLLNYQLVFITSAVFNTLGLLWLVFLVNEKRDKINLEKIDSNNSENKIENTSQTHSSDTWRVGLSDKPLDSGSTVEEKNKRNGFQMLFDFDNVRDLIKMATKPRKNKARLQLWLIIFSIVFVLLAHLAPLYVMYPFAERVYLWNSEKYSEYNSLALLISSIGIMSGTLILTKILKVEDISMAIIGIVSYFVASVLRGTFQNVYGFWSAVCVGCIGGIAPVGIRAYISKIIDFDELGKAFSLIASIDGSIPLVANFFFTTIFTATIESLPGAVFQATAATTLIPLFVLIYIDIFCRNKSEKMDENKNSIQTNI